MRRRIISTSPPWCHHDLIIAILRFPDFDFRGFWVSWFPGFWASADFECLGFLFSWILSFPGIKFHRFFVYRILGFPNFESPRFWVSWILGFPAFEYLLFRVSWIHNFLDLEFLESHFGKIQTFTIFRSQILSSQFLCLVLCTSYSSNQLFFQPVIL